MRAPCKIQRLELQCFSNSRVPSVIFRLSKAALKVEGGGEFLCLTKTQIKNKETKKFSMVTMLEVFIFVN